MTLHTSPILTSLLDTDAYKLHMQQAVYHHYFDVDVTAEFRCRGDELLGVYADEIIAQVELMSQLALSEEEFNYLSSLPFFKSDYLNWLKTFRFNPQQIRVKNHHGKLDIRITGPWREVILWEVPLLAVISEVVHRIRSPAVTVDAALKQLHHTLAHFRASSTDIDLSHFKLMDFGTRRRFSRKIQQQIVTTLQAEFPYLIGTSNYDLARRLALNPVGTQAHEWFQAHQQISPTLENSQRAALQAWLQEYPDQLGIALTDCITMDAFLRDFDGTFAQRYQGLRHDSGDPIAWGEKAIAHYQRLGIDPLTKTLVFSDSLNLDKALKIYCHFWQRINLIFGIGTHLTCDIPGVTPLNIVIKLVECNGKPVAKLSDSPGKTICRDPAFVSALRKAFDLPLVKKAS
ncbi:nicotinate phosphoribosyltransferase [Pectobacteriaceae bacterium CE70]|uniref:Nicotinate phosphoribosyltransferase n=1 Tax=Serratia sp. (strain ATCC 39006) TaxID=104623 RepID=A0A2I5TJN8_SERS3|nr:nicotinate phosphoribosyltransferase [Serratia sp. ATCC 39006]WJV60847.1 nicotinate phosphoribosyltransferase [Pectobacteriaceae bacterium C52]WJV68702.1 nicotinate phosphoribosyltransferase [Pectobacteriaceae bacterium CE70]WJY12629.1 nicotinate phosphoribosyltransferase [Pectobacteriaceae bacterium C80]AUH00465.1 nicotinate phosphoribosyltransferase [Serratia sp. ATCC 39006]AUH04785.1 nicotinate phosphoribosyltransferase [Serratia sp. ATCC 39006]